MLENFKIAIGTFLFRFVQSFNNYSDTTFIAGIFGIVSIEKSYSLLFMTSGEPVTNKILDLSDVHELDIIDVSELLAFHNHIRRNAFVAHSFGIGFVLFASFINFVSHLRRRKTVVAFDIVGMNTFAFEFFFSEPVVKRYMSGISDKLIVKAVNALGIGTMLTQHFSCSNFVFRVNSRAVEAFTSRSVTAFGVSLGLIAIFLRKRRLRVNSNTI